MTSLKKETPEYLVMARAARAGVNVQRWWADVAMQMKIPAWCRLTRMLLLLPTSSAAVERVFSIMRNAFGSKRRDSALRDLIEATCMEQYNNRDRPDRTCGRACR